MPINYEYNFSKTTTHMPQVRLLFVSAIYKLI